MEKMQQMMEEELQKILLKNFFLLGVDVITSGNHIWDKEETTNLLMKKKDF